MTATYQIKTAILPGMFTGVSHATVQFNLHSGSVSWVHTGKHAHAVNVSEISAVHIKTGHFYADVTITVDGKAVFFGGLPRDSAARLFGLIERRRDAGQLLDRADRLVAAISAAVKHPHYLSFSRYAALCGDHLQDVTATIADLSYLVGLGYTDHEGRSLTAALDALRPHADGDTREKHNRAIMEAHRRQYADFFRTVEKTPLSDEQIEAILLNEDRNLVVASAGSGKTSTIVGKVGYLVSSGHSKPEEILTLAFASDASVELNKRLSSRLSGLMAQGQAIEASTFHALGLAIIGQALGSRPNVCKNPDRAIEEAINELLETDARFARAWTLFNVVHARRVQTLPEFSSRARYNAYLVACGARRKQGEQLRITTLQGEEVASMEEAAIANWLFCKGVCYVYEKPYPYQTADQQHRQYMPDFYFPDGDFFLEHLGLNEKGEPAPFLGEAYLAGVEWKRNLHMEKGTVLEETTSAMMRDGSLFPHLERVLTARGVPFRPRSTEEIQAAIEQNNVRLQSKQRLVSTFIHHLKSNELKPAAILTDKALSARERLFVQIVEMVLAKYTAKLRDVGEVDFDDMINVATKLLRQGRVKLPYKVIIVDEFQDLANSRANLIKALLDQHPDSMLFAVGDDWQAIYRFAGSDISAMTRFADNFGTPVVTNLTRTYRCNQGIADAASTFVQANPFQLSKQVRSHDQKRDEVIEVLRYEKDGMQAGAVFDRIEALVSGLHAKKPSVFILTRYNREMEPFLTSPRLEQLMQKADISVRTFHSSKGLEADYVFMPGLTEGCMPSTIEDDPLLALVMPRPEPFPVAEERRLFYVGLTRARHRVVIYAEAGRESPFVEELEAITDDAILRREILSAEGVVIDQKTVVWCKKCSGYMVQRESQYGKFLGCSNWPDCTHTVDGHSHDEGRPPPRARAGHRAPQAPAGVA